MDILDKLSGNKSNRVFNDTSQEAKKEIPKDKRVLKRVFRLSGTTFSGYDFESLSKQDKVKLILDPEGIKTNPHNDKTAIAVFDSDNKHIAYIPKDQAKLIYPMIETGSLVADAYVLEVSGGGDYNWGIQILVRFNET